MLEVSYTYAGRDTLAVAGVSTAVYGIRRVVAACLPLPDEQLLQYRPSARRSLRLITIAATEMGNVFS